ncbi:hypothetical protein EMEDMD4_230019 [Sinorhizobium medicae]|uniref:Uncharacterized protein n=1 Tax=Sinorhizobium medicae TaxID=110321 RepID=A0A508WYG9_9HYPH|nr:hypothetical protein EMEDMD4_230019 [Sinorhizobium medicae]
MAIALRELEFPCQPVVSGRKSAGEVKRNCGKVRFYCTKAAVSSLIRYLGPRKERFYRSGGRKMA